MSGDKGLRRGGLARWEGHHYDYDHGNPVPGWLIPDIAEGILKDGLLELGDPDESGMRRVAPTEAGLARPTSGCWWSVLCWAPSDPRTGGGAHGFRTSAAP